jgi:hypothetical protein
MAKSRQPKDFSFDRQIAGFSPKQMEFVRRMSSGRYKYGLYGGALGGGKSYTLRWYALRRLIYLFKYYGLRGAIAMIACEDYPTLKHRQLDRCIIEFTSKGKQFGFNFGRLYKKEREYVLHDDWGGGKIIFGNLDEPAKYASAEFCLIAVDELTKNTYDVFTHLRTRLRWPGLPDHETQFIAGTNPGSIGHSWVKQLWIDRDFGEEWSGFEDRFIYVQSLMKDNPHLDASYYKILDTLPPQIRSAFRDGDWNIFVGQAFDFNPKHHVMKRSEGPPQIPPRMAPLYTTFDWGFGAPFSWAWWYVDEKDRLIRFAEWYGWNGTANEGMRITDEEIAEGVVEREKKMGLGGASITRLAGHDCFQKRPNYLGGGQGPSTAEVFAKHGLILIKADSNRVLKIRAFRERLRVREDGKPGLIVTENCKHFIRTIPNLVTDERHFEDIDTKSEDHVYDEACHICMFRAEAFREEVPEPVKTMAQQDWEMVTGQVEDAEGEAWYLDDYEMEMIA